MRLYCLRVESELIEEYLRECYISIHLPWLNEDAEHLSWQELCGTHEHAKNSEPARLFIDVMEDGDFIIMTDGTSAYLGDMGDYFFVQDCSSEVEVQNAQSQLPPRLHRRGVTWLRSLSEQMNLMAPDLKQFIVGTEYLALYNKEVSLDELELLFNYEMQQAAIDQQLHKGTASGADDIADYIDDALIREAIEVLKLALRSDDAERRERAAIALLNFAKK